MMRLDRYLFIVLAAAMALVLFALLGLTAVFALVEELRERDSAYGAIEAMRYVALTLPRRGYELVPYAVFLGAVVGLGELVRHAEITVLRASGVSVPRLFLAAAAPSILFLTVAALVGEVVAPRLESNARAAKAAVQSHGGEAGSRNERWIREGSAFVRIGSFAHDGRLAGVREYRFDDARRLVVMRAAESATFDPVRGGLTLHDVRESVLAADGVRAQSLAAHESALSADPRGASTAPRRAEPRERPLADLGSDVARLEPGSRERGRYALVWWSRVLQPFAILGLTALALVFVVGPLREVSVGARVSAGIGAGLAFKYLQDLLGPMAIVYSMPPFLAVAIPIAICWIAAAFGWRRIG